MDFEYNAPKFLNFLESHSMENDGADTFFDCHVGDTPQSAKQQSRIPDDKKEPHVEDSLQATEVTTSQTPEKECHSGDTPGPAKQWSCTSDADKDLSCVSNETYTISPAHSTLARLKELDDIKEENDRSNLKELENKKKTSSLKELNNIKEENETCNLRVLKDVKEQNDISDLISNVQELSVKTPVKHDSVNIRKEKTPKVHPMSLRSDTKRASVSKNVVPKTAYSSCDKMKSEKNKVASSEGTLETRRKLAFPTVSQDKSTVNRDMSKRKGSPLVGATNKRFVSLAEAVIHFQQNTPERFHSQPHAKASLIRRLAHKKHFSPPHGTIPQSPLLLTKDRARPVNCLSREAKEEKELEEIKSYQLKARPLDKKVFEGWIPPPVEKKATTVPHPFNLTEIRKKENKPPEVFAFTAKPVPKKILEGPQGIPEKKVQPATNPVTPNVARKTKLYAATIVQDEHDGLHIVNKEVPHEGVKVHYQRHATEIRPFTFEERDRELQRRKEERLQRILEEEKKAREFKANPLPSFIKSPRNVSMSILRKKNDSREEEEEHHVFKARPATVLHKKPFVPEKVVHPLTDTTDIVLNTERRIKERENFEKQLREREALIEEYKRREAERLKQEEEEARAIMRKMAVHKANPIRKYKIVDVQPSEKLLTAPNSPACYKRQTEK